MKSNNEIRLSTLTTQEMVDFVESCIRESDFKKYITNESENYKSSLVICKGEKLLGVVIPCITENTGVKIAEPALYMKYKKSIYIVDIIRKIMSYLFEELNVERIEARIYSNNKSMLSMMKYLNMTYEGKLPYAKVMDGECVDVYYYALSKNNV